MSELRASAWTGKFLLVHANPSNTHQISVRLTQVLSVPTSFFRSSTGAPTQQVTPVSHQHLNIVRTNLHERGQCDLLTNLFLYFPYVLSDQFKRGIVARSFFPTQAIHQASSIQMVTRLSNLGWIAECISTFDRYAK